MGRLPGGIIDGYRETIHRDIIQPTLRKGLGTPSLRMGTAGSGRSMGTAPPNTAPAPLSTASMGGLPATAQLGSNRRFLATGGGQETNGSFAATSPKRRMTVHEKRRQIFMASTTKIPLRPVRPTHPRNMNSFVPKKGHYASVPWTNIGGKATGVRGEYMYAIEGPPSPRPIVHMPRWLPSTPGERSVGLGTNFGLFSKPINEPHGVERRPLSFEGSSNRMISQEHYPIQILPTVVGKS